MNLNIHKHSVVCPECGSRDIHMEYESYGCNFLSRICQKDVENVPGEELWYYCQNCGLVFDPATQEIMTVSA
ncbi:MAG: hypothetical protein LBL24_04660 [Bacteroidales bacterium]|nr:hypothetical protein [Bacteroidales bacterium]